MYDVSVSMKKFIADIYKLNILYDSFIILPP